MTIQNTRFCITVFVYALAVHPIAAAEVEFPAQVQPGNIFTAGETVEVKAAIQSGSGVQWVVSDFQGKALAAGALPAVNHAILVAPKITEPGYYALQIAAMRGPSILGVGRTTFAIVPRFDIARMADSRYGAMTHFATGMPLDERLLPILAKGGISWIRDEQPWNSLEKTRGQYDFPRACTAYMEAAKKTDMNVLFDASFGNELYDAQPGVKVYKLAPYTADGYSGYANYCAAALERYGQQLRNIEIWNEYNGTFCDGVAAKDRPKYYTELLKAAYTKVKSVRPDVQVLGCAAVNIPIPYLEKLFKLGALDFMDAIAVHPYQSPETIVRSLTGLVELTKKYNGGKPKPVWATECGDADDKTPDRAEAASYLVRMMVLESTFPEVQRIIWYLSRDFREFGNMGLVHADTDPSGAFTPVMPYVAYANLIHLLCDTHFVQREKTDDRTHVYRFESPSQTVWACWSDAGSARMNFTGPVRRLNIVGSEMAPVSGEQSRVILDAMPIFVVAKNGAVSNVTENPRSDQVIANSLRDFSSEQGKGGWSYGYVGNNKTGSALYDPAKVQPMVWKTLPGDWADVWTGPGSYFSLGEQGGSGGVIGGGQGWAVLRWTSDRGGPVHITASPRSPSMKGDGIGVKVFADGKELFSQLLPPGSRAAIDLMPTLSPGTRLDFVVTPGPGTDTSFDHADWNISILTPPIETSR